ncbi:MAG: hypothetical protein ACFFCO_10755 [Promethearchaeota archaeon]
MSKYPHHYLPVSLLHGDLIGLVPEGDTIMYTSRVLVLKPSYWGTKFASHLVLTDNGVAFRAIKARYKDIAKAMGDSLDYIPYGLITKFVNKRHLVRIKYVDQVDPDLRRGWKFKIDRCKEVKENKASWGARKFQFGDYFEDLYYRAIRGK